MGRPLDQRDDVSGAGAGAAAPHLVVRQVAKRYGPATVLDNVDLTIARGELVTLLGPSGCGKTTLLRVIAGLTSPDAGQVALAGRNLTRVPPHKRRVGVVFQSYALFPHLSVAGNVAFGLKLRGLSRAEIEARVARVLGLVQLQHLGSRAISALSGGQQQRVALARAIAVEPEVLLFDEALSALDRKLREEMQDELRRLLREIGATAIFVTHDQDEALTMSDRVGVMNRGRIEQMADPVTLYSRPTSLFALSFVGMSTQIAGTVAAAHDRLVEVDTPLGRLTANGHFRPGSPVIVAVRPEHIQPSDKNVESNVATGVVRWTSFHGSRIRVEVDASGVQIVAELVHGNAPTPRIGDMMTLLWPIAETFAFPAPASVS
jgi:putative spermidine/putrescine transport system ATP-binding protein